MITSVMSEERHYISLSVFVFVLKAKSRMLAKNSQAQGSLMNVVAYSSRVPGSSRAVLIRRKTGRRRVLTVGSVLMRSLAAFVVAGVLEYFGKVPLWAGFVAFAPAFLFAEKLFPEPSGRDQ